jgi:2-dehydro-3-deoxyphosphogluconate aldolase/(4S)-4-hydroxy-2-oxoglutarate aldolase
VNAVAPVRLLDVLGETPIMAIVRLDDATRAVESAVVLAEAGVRVIEFSLSAGRVALDAISETRSRLAGRSVLVGAGTVLDGDAAAAAGEAGAQFLVSPGLSRAVASHAGTAGLPYVPGAMTPTEVQTALSWDPPLVKLFPAATLGPRYVADLLGPFPGAKLLATGGITAANAGEFIAAGAAAVAAAGALVNERTAQNPGELAATAAGLLAAIEGSRE